MPDPFFLACAGISAWKEIPFSLLAAIVLFVVANDHLLDESQVSDFTRVDGLVFLSFFMIFFVLGISAIIKPLPYQMKNNRDIGYSLCQIQLQPALSHSAAMPRASHPFGN